MSGKDRKVYACVRSFLHDNNKPLLELFDNTCLSNLIDVNAYKNEGLTFLNPDKKMTDELVGLLEHKKGNAQENMRNLIMQLKALCIFGYAATPNALNDRVNRLVQPVSVKDGMLDGTHKIVQADFEAVQMPDVILAKGDKVKARTSLQNVFDISGPLLKTDKSKAAPKKSHAGGHALEIQNDPASYAAEIEEMWLENFLKMKVLKQSKMADPYLEAVLSYLFYLKQNHRDIYKDILPKIDLIPLVSFYLILHPYNKILPDKYSEWFAATRGRFICVCDPLDLYQTLLQEAASIVSQKKIPDYSKLPFSAETLSNFVSQFGEDELNTLYARYRIYHLLDQVYGEDRKDDITNAFKQLGGLLRSSLSQTAYQATPRLLNVTNLVKDADKEAIVTSIDHIVKTDIPQLIMQHGNAPGIFPDFSQKPGSVIHKYAPFGVSIMNQSDIEISGEVAKNLISMCQSCGTSE